MPSASPPSNYRLGLAIIAELNKIGRDSEVDWLTKPSTVGWFPGAAASAAAALPAIFVRLPAAKPDPMIGLARWKDAKRFRIGCLTEVGEWADIEEAIDALVRDVRRCLRMNFRGFSGVVGAGTAWEDGHDEPEIDHASGVASCVIYLQADIVTTETNP